MSHLLVDLVGLTLIWVLHDLALLPSYYRFCQIPQWNTQNPVNQPKVYESMGHLLLSKSKDVF